MIWSYAYTPAIWPSVGTVLLLLVLTAYSWRRRRVPGALPFTVYCLLAAPMLVFKIIAYLAVNFETKVFWFKFENPLWLPVATSMTCFVLEYAWPGRWLTRRNLALLSIVPLLTLALLATNDSHHLLLTGFGFNGSVVAVYGPLGKFVLVYAIVLTILNILVFAWLFVRSPQHRWPVVLMMVAQIIARGLTFIDPFIRDSWFFYMPEVAFTVIACAIALFALGIFDPVPLARLTAIRQMHVGMLVLDAQERITSLNPAAEQMLGVTATHAGRRSIQELLPAYPDRLLPASGETEIEFSRGAGTETRHYTITISRLDDFRGLPIGRLLLLRDVTAQKRAQEQILKQQRTLAALHERERLARELHDNLGQTLAAAHLQASAARLLLAQGEKPEADECLEQVLEMTSTAETDVREYLLGAKIFFPANLPFFVGLRHYVQRFTQLYGLRVELSVPAQLEAQGLDQETGVQAQRIIQEALSNVRKHARASSALVTFSQTDGRVQFAICDDGQGFEPEAVREAEGFGFRSMRERAEALGGSLKVTSRPGQGTQVVVDLPLRGEAEEQAHSFAKKGRPGAPGIRIGEGREGDEEEYADG